MATVQQLALADVLVCTFSSNIPRLAHALALAAADGLPEPNAAAGPPSESESRWHYPAGAVDAGGATTTAAIQDPHPEILSRRHSPYQQDGDTASDSEFNLKSRSFKLGSTAESKSRGLGAAVARVRPLPPCSLDHPWYASP